MRVHVTIDGTIIAGLSSVGRDSISEEEHFPSLKIWRPQSLVKGIIQSKSHNVKVGGCGGSGV